MAAVIAYCGIPTKLPDEQPLTLDVASTKKLASYAVKHVYQFTSSRPRNSTTHGQTFLLETRDLIAWQFRERYGSVGSAAATANVYPYFIGVFDTVAALLNPMMSLSLILLFLLLDVIASWLLLLLPGLPTTGRWLSFLSAFWPNFAGVAGATFVLILVGYVYTHLKFDFGVFGYGFWQKMRAIHLTELYQKFYDYTLNPNVLYAKHAISIDENRKDFARVAWYRAVTGSGIRDEKGNIFFEQVWFPGNHADIGGGYEENELRLSDICLQWMLDGATAIPHPVKLDPSVLVTHPAPEGRRHDEVRSGFGIITMLTGKTWSEQHRKLPSNDAPMHRSVYERFDLRAALEYDTWRPYRPETLRNHVDFEKYYKAGSAFPSASLKEATALA